jgi:hypothetical protein
MTGQTERRFLTIIGVDCDRPTDSHKYDSSRHGEEAYTRMCITHLKCVSRGLGANAWMANRLN